MLKMRNYRAAAIGIFICVIASPLWAGIPIAASEFNNNNEGWTIVTTLGPPPAPTVHVETGGNPGGFIYGVDPDEGAWGFSAPGKFLDDVSDAYGQTFSFDIAAYNSPQGPTAWVGLDGGGYMLVCPFDAPGSVYPAWHSRSVTMTETAGWFDPITFEVPDYNRMIAVLSDLDALVITAEFVAGFDNDISGLDNVVLMPEPATLALLLGGSVLVIVRRKR